MADTKAIAEAIKKAAEGLDGVKIYISADWGTGDIALKAVVPMEKNADGQCPKCGGMTHNYGGPAMRCPDCGWTEQGAEC